MSVVHVYYVLLKKYELQSLTNKNMTFIMYKECVLFFFKLSMRYQDHGQFVGFGRSSLHLTMSDVILVVPYSYHPLHLGRKFLPLGRENV